MGLSTATCAVNRGNQPTKVIITSRENSLLLSLKKKKKKKTGHKDALCILGAIFLPVTMLIGIGIAFKEVFWEVMKDSGKDICSSLS